MSRPPAPSPPSSAKDVVEQLTGDLRALPAGLRNAPEAVHREYMQTLGIAQRWLRLVDERRRAAEGSPSDQARWSACTAAVEQEPGRHPDQQSLVLLLGTVRQMLNDLRATQPPCPTVTDVTARIMEMIESDPAVYPPGARVPVLPLVKEMGIPRKHLDLAVDDLRATGLLDPSIGPVRVRPGPPGARRLNAAGWLRTLIRTGVYPPGRYLPPHRELARILAIDTTPVKDITDALSREGTVHLRHGRPLVVLSGAQTPPFDLTAVLAPLKHQPQPPGGPDLVHATARRTRSSWVARLCPPAPELNADIGVLRAAVVHLAPLVHHQHPDATPVVARAAVTAAEPLPHDDHQRLWRAACLAIAAQDLLSELTVRSL